MKRNKSTIKCKPNRYSVWECRHVSYESINAKTNKNYQMCGVLPHTATQPSNCCLQLKTKQLWQTQRLCRSNLPNKHQSFNRGRNWVLGILYRHIYDHTHLPRRENNKHCGLVTSGERQPTEPLVNNTIHEEQDTSKRTPDSDATRCARPTWQRGEPKATETSPWEGSDCVRRSTSVDGSAAARCPPRPNCLTTVETGRMGPLGPVTCWANAAAADVRTRWGGCSDRYWHPDLHRAETG